MGNTTTVSKPASNQTKTSGAMSFGLMRPKWRRWTLTRCTTFGKIKPNIAYQHKLFNISCQAQRWRVIIWACYADKGPGHLAVIEVVIAITEYSKIFYSQLCHHCAANCPTAKSSTKLCTNTLIPKHTCKPTTD